MYEWNHINKSREFKINNHNFLQRRQPSILPCAIRKMLANPAPPLFFPICEPLLKFPFKHVDWSFRTYLCAWQPLIIFLHNFPTLHSQRRSYIHRTDLLNPIVSLELCHLSHCINVSFNFIIGIRLEFHIVQLTCY